MGFCSQNMQRELLPFCAPFFQTLPVYLIGPYGIGTRLYKFRVGGGCLGPVTVEFVRDSFVVECPFSFVYGSDDRSKMPRHGPYCGSLAPAPWTLARGGGVASVRFVSLFGNLDLWTGFKALVCASACN